MGDCLPATPFVVVVGGEIDDFGYFLLPANRSLAQWNRSSLLSAPPNYLYFSSAVGGGIKGSVDLVDLGIMMIKEL